MKRIFLSSAAALAVVHMMSASPVMAATCGGEPWTVSAFLSGACAGAGIKNEPGDNSEHPAIVHENPTAPTEPTQPGTEEPTTPTDPGTEEPTEPTDPTGPTDPTDPGTENPGEGGEQPGDNGGGDQGGGEDDGGDNGGEGQTEAQ